MYILVLCALFVVACENSSSDNPHIELKDMPITIGSSLSFSRASITDLQSDGFGVWAFITNSEQDNYPYMVNTLVKKIDGEWFYSPTKYWLNDTQFTFVATCPYGANGDAFTVDTSSGAVELTLSVSETPSEYDYLVAKEDINTSDSNFDPTDAVLLQFQHLLSNVSLKVWREGVKHENDQMRIRKVTLSNIRKAGTYNSSTDTWEATNVKLTLVDENNDVADSDNIGAAVKQGNNWTFGGVGYTPFNEELLIPQTIDASNAISLKIDYELKRLNAVEWEKAELETFLPTNTWIAGQKYTYNVVLSSVTDITVYYIQTKVDPWGTPQVGGTVIIK